MKRGEQNSRIVIMGAAGRDFHNFNVVYRNDPNVRVLAFTAAQIPGISGRTYPPSLAGRLYPKGIPIIPEDQLVTFLEKKNVTEVVFAYSDVTHHHVMHQASSVLAAGADFTLLGPGRTSLCADIPVLSISAVRTGCGKSQTMRWVSDLVQRSGLKGAIVRHPMPYGNLEEQATQEFSNLEDLSSANCTIEEREEYEPHLARGHSVYAGVDYALILDQAQRAADIILWEGGNNDFPFYKPDLHIVLLDPLRSGHEKLYHPGEAVVRMADVIVISKSNAASQEAIDEVVRSARRLNPTAIVVHGNSTVTLDDPKLVRGRKILVVEDGPSITHGGLPTGAGYTAAQAADVEEIVDPRPFAKGEIAKVYEQYSHIGPVLPAVGYGSSLLDDLKATIRAANPNLIISATPCDIAALLSLQIPLVRARYEFSERDEGALETLIKLFLVKKGLLEKSLEAPN